MNKLKELSSKFLPNVPYDKKLHFLCGFAIALIGGIITDPITGIGLAIAAGIAKECYDDYSYGKFDIADMLTTWIGGACGFTVVSLCKYWFG